jgi:acetyl-CoA C-acetyltransferase
MKIHIAGAGMTKFGELWDASPRGLARVAVGKAIDDAKIRKEEIKALFVGNMLSGMLGSQEHLGAFFAEELGLSGISATKIEGACASGGLAMHAAVTAISSGLYETVLVLGVEKMTDHKPEDVASALMGAGSEEERLSGISFPGLYAILARSHMDEFGTTEEQMAAVAVKNHYHASLNPNAQFHNLLTVESVMKSPCVADPLKLYDCSPISDGAAAVILTGKKTKSGISIIASCVATDTLSLSRRKSLTELSATREASRKAYTEARVTPKDIDIAEVHDCFSIAEIMALEDLGFFNKGNAAREIAKGNVTVGVSKKLTVNTSGGLKGCGHPVGATGVKQIVELVDQLQGRAGNRQVKKPKIGLSHNVGGSGATAVVHILSK